jgi:uncharacterized protein YegP (UPF0339 family)
MKYQLADLTFSSKTKVTAFFKQMRDKYISRLNYPITDANDIKYLTALTYLIHKGDFLQYLKYFTVMQNNFGTYGFRMMLKSNFTETISYRMEKYTQKTKAIQGLRYAIIKDIFEFKAQYPHAEEIHHALRYFSEIEKEFVGDRGYDFIQIHHMEAGGFEMSDNLLKQEWIDFHRQHANLKALSHKEHRREHSGRAN